MTRTRASGVSRHGPAERALHWTVAAAVLALVLTGAVMYVPALSQTVGQRFWVRAVHLAAAAGLALAPGALALPGWRELRALERELSSWSAADVEWFVRPWRLLADAADA